jgi:hypothetical protein
MSGKCEKCGEHCLDCKCDDRDRIELEYCHLSYRAVSVLKYHGIIYLDQLVQCSAGQLLSFKNFGKKSLKDVREFLEKEHLCLRNDELKPLEKKIILHDVPQILEHIQKQIHKSKCEFMHFTILVMDAINEMKRKLD